MVDVFLENVVIGQVLTSKDNVVGFIDFLLHPLFPYLGDIVPN